MNTLRRISRQTPQCLRRFTTSSRPQRAAGVHDAFLDEMDPTKQAQAQPPAPNTDSLASDLTRLLGGTRQNTAGPNATRQRFSAPTGRPSAASHELALQELARVGGERGVLNQTPRKWKEGDVYAPHDLSIGEAKKWKKIVRRPEKDCFDMLGKNPMLFYKNLPLLDHFTSETGRIRAGKETGLRLRNQRRVARAVRRAIGIGLMPSVYRHPELDHDKLKITDYRQQRDIIN
ncbi:hypothetical protein BLS_005455 [Venturia inaequalis]|uniref:Small ribosomal subunit protein bS18m n=1 Tax=Venturia inaequalis TaxID=5025 RepID=A0A8H3YY86_VENIN|nr:hypothetical protein BLS_005455 [Venturia inaequalis]KAE9973301.1 hypothetical protein EG328_004480 [Venturia inaequalis]RDI81324.1 hypothetical protein Vi05172_g8696 [Venturia inaequalis]